MRTLPIAFVLALTFTAARNAEAGRIVVKADEWTLSDFGFAQSPDAGMFINNVLSLFTGGGSATVHAYSNNFSYTGTSLSGALSSAGHAYSTGTGIAFDLATLSGFDAIFLGGDLISTARVAALHGYVALGGNVYVAGGTSFTNPASVAASFNPFLSTYGLSFVSINNPGIFAGNIDVNGASHAVPEWSAVDRGDRRGLLPPWLRIVRGSAVADG